MLTANENDMFDFSNRFYSMWFLASERVPETELSCIKGSTCTTNKNREFIPKTSHTKLPLWVLRGHGRDHHSSLHICYFEVAIFSRAQQMPAIYKTRQLPVIFNLTSGIMRAPTFLFSMAYILQPSAMHICSKEGLVQFEGPFSQMASEPQFQNHMNTSFMNIMWRMFQK